MDEQPAQDTVYDAAEREFRALRESKWQKQMAPLAIVREMRETILVWVLLSEEPTLQQQSILERILAVEKSLLCKLRAKDANRLIEDLAIDHQESWREVIEWLRSDGLSPATVELQDFARIAKAVLQQLQSDLEK